MLRSNKLHMKIHEKALKNHGHSFQPAAPKDSIKFGQFARLREVEFHARWSVLQRFKNCFHSSLEATNWGLLERPWGQNQLCSSIYSRISQSRSQCHLRAGPLSHCRMSLTFQAPKDAMRIHKSSTQIKRQEQILIVIYSWVNVDWYIVYICL